MSDKTVFVTTAGTSKERSCARTLVASIRSFGGALSESPIWLFEPDPFGAPWGALGDEAVRVLPLRVPDNVKHQFFADRVCACARAEELAGTRFQSLVWIDPVCLVVNPPLLFDLGEAIDAAVRPVHIQNVGLGATEPLDGFWGKVCETVGLGDIQTTVETFVDAQPIRSYFNSHAFAVDPARGLLGRWFEHFEALVCDAAFQSAFCQDPPHKIFLFQAVLSALLVASLEPERIRLLPPDYNYPYNLHGMVPLGRRALALNDLVCIAYEDRHLDPELVGDVNIREPLRSWLSAHAGTRPLSPPPR